MNTTELLFRFIDCETSDPETTTERVWTTKVVCPTCEGGGTTVFGWGAGNGPSFVMCGDEDWADDEFRSSLFEGDFDRPCPECKGANVVDRLDVDGGNPPSVVERWERWERDEWELQMEAAAERRVGA